MSVLGVDLSTQSCTVEVRDSVTMHLIGRVRSPLPPTNPPVSEQSVNDWWGALKECMQYLASLDIPINEIEAVSVAGQCHGLVPLDEKGQEVRPVKLWNDTTSAQSAENLVSRVGVDEWVSQVGIVPTAALTISKLAFLMETEPEVMANVRKVVLPHDYLTWKLCGQFVTDRSEASGTGYYSSFTGKYLYEMLETLFGNALPWRSLFPRVLRASEIAGFITPSAARDLGLPCGIPVGPGGGDQHLAAVGLGLDTGDVAFSLGTSGVVFSRSDKSEPPVGGQVDYVASADGGWLPLVCTLNCTKVTDTASSWLGVDVKELDRLALSADPEKVRPVFATFLDGERTPRLPNANGMITGLTGQTTRSQIALSSFEGVVMGLLNGLELLRAAGVRPDGRYIAVGGGAKSAAYRQILADLLGQEIQRVDAPEATARGACIQALAVLRREDIRTVQKQFQPTKVDTVSPRGVRYWDGIWRHYKDAVRCSAVLAGSTAPNAQTSL